MKSNQSGEVDLAQYVGVHSYEGLVVEASLESGESDRPRGVERAVLDDITEPDTCARAVRVGINEGIWSVPERQHYFVDAMVREFFYDPFDNRAAGNGQHLLWCRQGKRAQPGALTTGQDHSFHGRARPARARPLIAIDVIS